MVRAVFFDWFATLADYEPPRDGLYCRAFGELGIKIPEDAATRGVALGDEFIYSENIRYPFAKRSPEERFEVYLAFPRMILKEANISAPPELLGKVRNRIRELFKPEDQVFVLFQDVLPNMKRLKAWGLALGVVTNLRGDMRAVCERLGLTPYLDVILTSELAGTPKPNPGIFLKACEMAGVKPEEAVYVGDLYQVDVEGSRRVGMKPIMIDRCELHAQVTDCPRITTLNGLEKHILRHLNNPGAKGG